jgi:two-component system response regulator DesR
VIKLFIIEGQGLLGELLSAHIDASRWGRVVGLASSAAHALERLDHAAPDIILLDWQLTEGEGAQLIADIGRVVPNCHIVVLSSRARVDVARDALGAGAAAFLARTTRLEILHGAISTVRAGYQFVDPASVRASALTRQEMAVLRLFATGLTVTEVASKICLAVHTVRTYAKRASTKLGARTRSQAVALAVREGLI